ncbi:MAG: glycosyltransferase [Thermoplasmatales archaeon]
MIKEPLVSVIIPTKNSELTLKRCLESVQNQSYKNIEIIVVDNYSTDKTKEIIKSFNAKFYEIGPERSAQKNFGATKANGEYLYFIDSDFVLSDNLISECISLVNEGCDAIFVTNISDPSISLWSKIRYYERISYIGSRIYEATRFIKKDIFFELGGFDENISADEDYDLQNRINRLNIKIGRTIKSFETHIGEPKNLKEILLKSLYYSKDANNYFQKTRNINQMLPIRYTFFRYSYLKKVFKEWPIGLLLVPMYKTFQFFLSVIGLFFKKNQDIQ